LDIDTPQVGLMEWVNMQIIHASITSDPQPKIL